MASPFIFRSLIFSQFLFLVIAQDGKCPSSFECGNLGTIRFPFTNAQRPHCGLLAIHGCDDQNPEALKSIQLSNTPIGRFHVLYVRYNNTIVIRDETQRKDLRSKSCRAFSNSYTLPPSPSPPLGSVRVTNNITLFRCNHSLHVTLPQHLYSYTKCPDYNIYYCSAPIGNPQGFKCPSSLTSCSKIQLALKDESDSNDPFSFLSDNIVIEVQISEDCRKCIHHERGQCQLDKQGKFYCIRDKNLAWKLGLGIGLPGFIIIIGSLLIIWHCKRRCDPDFYPNPQPESGSVYFGVPVFSYEDLEIATKDFDRSRVLGDGGFGTVYRGNLKDGREVAIKRLYEHNYRRVEQFMNEVQILTRLRHRNLVSLYGCTSRHSHELLLAYEYISNGTVACHLHGRLAKPGLLAWPTRIKIAIETATALAYLHASDIIHRDVKTNNILLDNSYSVKVADFGLSRLFPNDVTHISTAPQGTPGYVDPEYHRCYQLTSKSDVYSFGVVLIELISSKLAVDINRHKDEINLSDLAIKKIQKSAFGELVDPSLGFDSDSEAKRMIISVAELAFQCLQWDRELRPSMNEVLKVLIAIESGKDKPEHIEGIDVHPPPSPPSPDLDEIELLKNTTPPPSPKAVTDGWNSSESSTSRVSLV